MRTRRDIRAMKAIVRTLPWAVLVLAVGCSGVARHPETGVATTTTTTEPVEAPTELVDVRQDPGGFTITSREPVPEDVRVDYEAATRMIETGRDQEGVALLLALTERAPIVAAPHIALGIAYARGGDLDLAEESLHEALALNPHHPVALNELGLVQRRKGRFAESRASYEAALAQYADFHYAHRNLAILCDLYLGDAACALEHYEEYARIAPEDVEVTKWIADLRNRASREVNP